MSSFRSAFRLSLLMILECIIALNGFGCSAAPDSPRGSHGADRTIESSSFSDPLTCAEESTSALFRSREVVALEIQSQYFEDRYPREASPYSGTIQVTAESGTRELPVSVGVRGNSRQIFCDFKPIKLDFDDQDSLIGTVFENAQSKLKLVTHCLNDPEKREAGNQRILKEYAAYQVMESLGYPSMKARLIQAKYRNSSGALVGESYAFFTEPKKDLARRCGATYSEREEGVDDLQQRKLDPEYRAMEALRVISLRLAERLVFNAEVIYNVPHNNVLLLSNDTKREPLAMVGYDFDNSSLVRDGSYWPYWKAWDGTWGRYLENNISGKNWDSPRWTENDEIWLKHFVENPVVVDGYTGRVPSREEWRQAAAIEVSHVLSRRSAAFAAFEAVPGIDPSARLLWRQRFTEYFEALARFSEANP